jgi:hypothetical protein
MLEKGTFVTVKGGLTSWNMSALVSSHFFTQMV